MQINVTRSSMPSFEEYCEEIKELWDSHWLTNMGIKHRQLESQLRGYLDVPYVTLYTNGHLALENVIAAMKLPAGGEVITTPFTFASTTHAIVRNGLTPVFCDINDVDYTMDAARIEALITEKTCAIVPVHVYGNICDVDAIQKIAEGAGWGETYPIQDRSRLPKEFDGMTNGHNGTHHFIVDDFCRAFATGHLSPTNIWQVARWNIPGLLAQESALQGGVPIDVPDLGDPPADWPLITY